jgi:hypothetical protein
MHAVPASSSCIHRSLVRMRRLLHVAPEIGMGRMFQCFNVCSLLLLSDLSPPQIEMFNA